MRTLLSAAGRAFLRAFGVNLLYLLPGILAAPNLDGSTALGIAALVASLSAGFKALQVFLPQLEIGGTYGAIISDAVRGGIAAFLVFSIGILDAPELHLSRAIFYALLVAVGQGIVRALQGALTPQEPPALGAGLRVPGE